MCKSEMAANLKAELLSVMERFRLNELAPSVALSEIKRIKEQRLALESGVSSGVLHRALEEERMQA